MPVATSIVMDLVSFAWIRAVVLKRFPNCRNGVIGLVIAGNPENDGHLSPWQEAAGDETIPGTHKNDGHYEASTGVTPGLFVMLFQDVVFG